jgi:hypothetical protein
MKPDSSALVSGIITAIFIGTWIVLGVGGFIAV